jgi:hypothetical protein
MLYKVVSTTKLPIILDHYFMEPSQASTHLYKESSQQLERWLFKLLTSSFGLTFEAEQNTSFSLF